MQPSKESGNFWSDRATAGIGGALTFGTLAASSHRLRSLAGKSVAGHNAAELESAGRSSGLRSAFANPVAAGILSGVPAGVVGTEYNALVHDHRWHGSASDYGQAITSMSLVGGAFGVGGLAKGRRSSAAESNFDPTYDLNNDAQPHHVGRYRLPESQTEQAHRVSGINPPDETGGIRTDNCVASVAAVMRNKITKSGADLITAHDIERQFGSTGEERQFTLKTARRYLEEATGLHLTDKPISFKSKDAPVGHYAIFLGKQIKNPEHVVYGQILPGGNRYVFDPQDGQVLIWRELARNQLVHPVRFIDEKSQPQVSARGSASAGVEIQRTEANPTKTSPIAKQRSQQRSEIPEDGLSKNGLSSLSALVRNRIDRGDAKDGAVTATDIENAFGHVSRKDQPNVKSAVQYVESATGINLGSSPVSFKSNAAAAGDYAIFAGASSKHAPNGVYYGHVELNGTHHIVDPASKKSVPWKELSSKGAVQAFKFKDDLVQNKPAAEVKSLADLHRTAQADHGVILPRVLNHVERHQDVIDSMEARGLAELINSSSFTRGFGVKEAANRLASTTGFRLENAAFWDGKPGHYAVFIYGKDGRSVDTVLAGEILANGKRSLIDPKTGNVLPETFLQGKLYMPFKFAEYRHIQGINPPLEHGVIKTDNDLACLAAVVRNKVNKKGICQLVTAHDIEKSFGHVDKTQKIEKDVRYIEDATSLRLSKEPESFIDPQAQPGHYAIFVGDNPTKPERVMYGEVLPNGNRYIFNGQDGKTLSWEDLTQGKNLVEARRFEPARSLQTLQDGTFITVDGTVSKVMKTRKGSLAPHQAFEVQLPSGESIQVRHNLKLANKIPIHVGSSLRLQGEYVKENAAAGVPTLHYTHHHNNPSHPQGWIDYEGKRYQ